MTPKQKLIEALVNKRIESSDMDHHIEYVEGFEDGLLTSMQLIQEILP